MSVWGLRNVHRKVQRKRKNVEEKTWREHNILLSKERQFTTDERIFSLRHYKSTRDISARIRDCSPSRWPAPSGQAAGQAAGSHAAAPGADCRGLTSANQQPASTRNPRLVLGCTDADFGHQIVILQHFSRSTRFAYFCTSRNLNSWRKLSNISRNFANFAKNLKIWKKLWFFLKITKILTKFCKILRFERRRIVKIL